MKLDIFQCPSCRESLSDSMHCEKCNAQYSNLENIWSFLDGAIDAGFDERWKRHPKPQATTAGILWDKTGWKSSDLEKKLVLDAGCGCGRFSRVASDAGAIVVGIDGAPHAIRAAKTLVPKAEFVHGDLKKLPFKNETFDAVFSIGVVHHTSDPATTFAELARVVRPGGELAVWVYTEPSNHLKPMIEFLHVITKACPPEVLYEACERYGVQIRDMYRKDGYGPLASVLQVSGSKDDEECISDTFDWHTPQYRFWHRPEEVRGWFKKSGFEVVWTGDFPVSMRGKKQ